MVGLIHLYDEVVTWASPIENFWRWIWPNIQQETNVKWEHWDDVLLAAYITE